MATCKWCGKSGIFLTISDLGLCSSCDEGIRNEITLKVERLNESTEIIQQSSKTETIVERFDYIVGIYESLLRYEKRGVITLKVPPSKTLSEVYTPQERDRHIIYGLEKEFEVLKRGLVPLKTKKGRNNRVVQFFQKVASYKKELIDPQKVDEINSQIDLLLEAIDNETFPDQGILKDINDLLVNANRKTLLSYYRNSDVVLGIRILNSPNSCPECLELGKKRYRLTDTIPQLPHIGCTHEKGCRCCYIPLTNESDFI